MCVLIVVATVSGSVLGGAVNCVNGAVSPRFFHSHKLVWEHTSVWLSAVVQGVVEGGADGAIFGVVFMIVLWLATQGRCPLMTCYRSIRIAILVTLAVWVMGGCCGVACATLFPRFSARNILRIPRRVVVPGTLCMGIRIILGCHVWRSAGCGRRSAARRRFRRRRTCD